MYVDLEKEGWDLRHLALGTVLKQVKEKLKGDMGSSVAVLWAMAVLSEYIAKL